MPRFGRLHEPDLRDHRYLIERALGVSGKAILPATKTWRINPQALDHVLAEHVNGKQNHEKLLWALLNLEIWHRQYA